MRGITLAVVSLGLLVSGAGCMAFSTNVRGVCSKAVVVYNNELYVVDVNKRVARKVTLAPCDESTDTEVITIEVQD